MQLIRYFHNFIESNAWAFSYDKIMAYEGYYINKPDSSIQGELILWQPPQGKELLTEHFLVK